jgi:hypothetical protein
MDSVIRKIVKNQNEELLKNVATKLNFDQVEFLKKYHIPTYYYIHSDKNKNYNIDIIFR